MCHRDVEYSNSLWKWKPNPTSTGESQHPQILAAPGFSSPHMNRVVACLCLPSYGDNNHVSDAEWLSAASLQESW